MRTVVASPALAPTTQRFENLQVLRLFAGVGVVLFHVGGYARNGFGVSDGPVRWLMMDGVVTAFVPCFFALSGFGLTRALERLTPGRFAALRALRLYPSCWLAVGLVMLVHLAGLWPGPELGVADPAPNRRGLTLLPPRKVTPGQYPLLVEWTLVYEVFLSLAILALHRAVGRRRLALAGAAWVAAIAAKSFVRPGYGNEILPAWRGIWISTYLVPFFLGVLAYELRDRGRRWRWVALAVAIGSLAAASAWFPVPGSEPREWLRGISAAATVWFVVQVPNVSAKHPLAVAGGWSYGLFLVHVPVLVLAMYALHRAGVDVVTWGALSVVVLATCAVGLAYGRLETWLYARIRGLADADRLAAARAVLTTGVRRLTRRGTRRATGKG